MPWLADVQHAACTNPSDCVDSAGHLEPTLHDFLGRTLRTLVSGWREAGTHVARTSLEGVPPGVYFCRLWTGGVTATRRLLILR